MDTILYQEIVKELEQLDNLMWLTPFLGKRKALLEELKAHIESGKGA